MQTSLTGTTIEQSDSGRKNIPDLLQEAEEQEDEGANDDAYVTVESNKIDECNSDMIIRMKKEQKTLEYQEKRK